MKKMRATGMALAMTAVGAGVAWAAGGEGGHGNHWLTIDTWKTLNFGVLAVALFFLGKKPVVEFFSSRKTEIEDELKTLEQKIEKGELPSQVVIPEKVRPFPYLIHPAWYYGTALFFLICVYMGFRMFF